MALINSSYFFGTLLIAQKSDASVTASLNWFIDRFEEKLLLDVLGYDLYKAFINGLQEPSVDPKWTALLSGKEFQYNGINKKWFGLIESSEAITIALNNEQPKDIVVGRGQPGDPVADTNSVTIPAAYQGKNFVFEKRGFGPLIKNTEYTTTETTLTLSSGTFNNNEAFFYWLPQSVTISTSATNPKSLIANFVYWNYIQDQSTFTTGTGEKKVNNQNAINASNAVKMVTAWNEMVDKIRILCQFLTTNQTDYPEFINHFNSIDHSYLRYQNILGI